MADKATSSYIDVAKLTAPEFSVHAHANTLVLSTNNPSDPSIDLTTPLSKVLFDLQEIDSNIHTLTSREALEILKYTSTQNAAAARILARVEEDRAKLNASYGRLENEILGQYDRATKAKLRAERSHQVLKLGRDIQKALILARQFEALLKDSGLNAPNNAVPAARVAAKKEDHRLLLETCGKILDFRDLMSGRDAGELSRINLVREIRGRVFEDGEAQVLDYARRVVREFTVRSVATIAGSTFQEAEDAKARFTSAAHILYLLSPASRLNGAPMKKSDFEPEYLLRALQSYLQTAVTSSSAGIARALTQLPTLERALAEVSTRCQNIIALEALLKTITPPTHPLLNTQPTVSARPSKGAAADGDDEDTSSDDEPENTETLLALLLESFDTSSLPSFFWRSLASHLSTRVQEILNRGGLTARTLRSKVGDVRTQIRGCVLEGSKMPTSLLNAGHNVSGGKEQIVGNWEREAAVMVSSVVGPLSR